MKKLSTISYTLDILDRRGAVALSVTALALALLYGLLVSFSVTNVIVRDNTQQAAADLEGRLSALEFDYLSARDAVNEKRAVAIGLVPVSEKTYITRAPATRVAVRSE